MLEMGYCNTSHKGIKGEMFISKNTKKVFDKIAYPFKKKKLYKLAITSRNLFDRNIHACTKKYVYKDI